MLTSVYFSLSRLKTHTPIFNAPIKKTTILCSTFHKYILYTPINKLNQRIIFNHCALLITSFFTQFSSLFAALYF